MKHLASPDIFDGLIIDLTYDEEREILEEIVVNHTTRSAIPSQRRAATIPKRNANSIAKPIVRQRNRRIEPPYLDFGETDTDQGFKLEEGDTVELNENYVKKFGQFLFIRNVIFHETTLDIELRGLVLNRNSKAGGMLERQLNEVHISAEIDEDDPRSIFHQAMVDVPIQAVLCKRKLVFSDQLHPLENYQFNPEYDATMPKDIRIRHIVDHEHLTCRNVLLTSFPNAHGREHGCRRSQIRESNLWLVDIMIKELRSKVKYDSQTPPPTSPRKRPERSVSLEMRDSPPSKRTRLESSNISADQPITYASAFSGCGGDACGARMAGADVKGAFDENAECCKTFIMNFIRAQVLNKSAFYAQELVYAMLLHLSPPCQPWSPAHTIAGRNDAKNIDALFAVGEVISRQEPEFVTLEQTVGLLNKKNNRRYFNALVNQIIYAGQGYNIRWGVMDFRQYGVMSNRCRLVFIASR